MRARRGVVVGKFLPPHRGHALLIETALAGCEALDVIVCERVDDPIPGAERVAWLRELHPWARIRKIEDVYDADDSRLWAELTIGWLGGRPDVAFTSEDYGEAWAREMGCEHVLVDRARTRFPISGTAVRADPHASWDQLPPPVRGWYAKRVCLVGAESTGKTTLAEALARRLETVWVPEYGRELTEAKYARGDTRWSREDFVAIALEQQRREDAAARTANRIVVCDTNAFATTLWTRRYLGHHDPEVDAIGDRSRCDLYLLTGDEIPFVQDGIRDGEIIRHAMQDWFLEALARRATPVRRLRGGPDERMRDALAAIGALFTGSRWQPGSGSGRDARRPRRA